MNSNELFYRLKEAKYATITTDNGLEIVGYFLVSSMDRSYPGHNLFGFHREPRVETNVVAKLSDIRVKTIEKPKAKKSPKKKASK